MLIIVTIIINNNNCNVIIITITLIFFHMQVTSLDHDINVTCCLKLYKMEHKHFELTVRVWIDNPEAKNWNLYYQE